MTKEVEEEICYLYFEKMLSYSEIIVHFKGKYSYAAIKRVINRRYE